MRLSSTALEVSRISKNQTEHICSRNINLSVVVFTSGV